MIDSIPATGRYGCACPTPDADRCIRLRYGIGDNYRCLCVCHSWGDEVEFDSGPQLLEKFEQLNLIDAIPQAKR